MLEHLITWVFQLSILATAFGFGLKATTEDVQDLIRRPALLGRSLLAIFVIVPIVAVALAYAFENWTRHRHGTACRVLAALRARSGPCHRHGPARPVLAAALRARSGPTSQS